jgi:hypothetical protein
MLTAAAAAAAAVHNLHINPLSTITHNKVMDSGYSKILADEHAL